MIDRIRKQARLFTGDETIAMAVAAQPQLAVAMKEAVAEASDAVEVVGVEKAQAKAAAAATTAAKAAGVDAGVLTELVKATVRKERGQRLEAPVLDAVQASSATGSAITERNEESLRYACADFVLVGRIDGYEEDTGTVIEAKNRTSAPRNPPRPPPEHDLIQMRAYMAMKPAPFAQLVERYPDGTKRETLIMHDDHAWGLLCQRVKEMVTDRLRGITVADVETLTYNMLIHCSDDSGTGALQPRGRGRSSMQWRGAGAASALGGLELPLFGGMLPPDLLQLAGLDEETMLALVCAASLHSSGAAGGLLRAGATAGLRGDVLLVVDDDDAEDGAAGRSSSAAGSASSGSSASGEASSSGNISGAAAALLLGGNVAGMAVGIDGVVAALLTSDASARVAGATTAEMAGSPASDEASGTAPNTADIQPRAAPESAVSADVPIDSSAVVDGASAAAAVVAPPARAAAEAASGAPAPSTPATSCAPAAAPLADA